jgi:hypothetical protein
VVIINCVLLAVKYNNSHLFCIMISNNCDGVITGKTLSSRENTLQKNSCIFFVLSVIHLSCVLAKVLGVNNGGTAETKAYCDYFSAINH